MRRAFLKNVSIYTNKLLIPSPQINHKQTTQSVLLIPKFNFTNSVKLFSSESDSSSDQNPTPDPSPNPNPTDTSESSLDVTRKNVSVDDVKDVTNQDTAESSLDVSQKNVSVDDVKDVSNQEFKSRIKKYFEGDEEALPSILEAILSRKLSGNHEDTDEELAEELEHTPLKKIKDEEIESDFEEAHETDEDIPHLYNAKEYVVKKMMKDPYFNMDDKKWNAIVEEGKIKGTVTDTRECEEILEDMLHWDKLLPENIQQEIRAKMDELEEKIESKELGEEEAYKQFKEFEDAIVAKEIKKMEEEKPVEESDEVMSEEKKSDDPPGEGPILRWHTRLVVVPGPDAWHPKNRKVKLAVTVKELGLSKYQFRRLREIVGKRYHCGRDELTITSERFEHREENRKDCLRTLLGIIEEAKKAETLVDEARTAYVKQRLQANPAFMARLHAKTKQAQPDAIPS